MANASSVPRLTIVIPTLNRARFVTRALESALAQKIDGIEVIVSNNGSIDDTRERLAAYSDPRLRIIHHDKTMSITKHGSYLVDAANGELFLGLSDDDYLEPDFCEKVLALFERRPALSFVYTKCMVHYGDIPVPTLTGPEEESYLDFVSAYLAGKRELCWCGCVTKTRDLQRFGPIPDGQICGDMFYWTQIARTGNVGAVPECVSHYTLMGDNDSAGAPVLAWANEMQQLVDNMASELARRCDQPEMLRKARDDGASYIARSTANQFIWNLLRGTNRGVLLQTVPATTKYIGTHLGSWIRVFMAVLLPRVIVRQIVLTGARWRSWARVAKKSSFNIIPKTM